MDKLDHLMVFADQAAAGSALAAVTTLDGGALVWTGEGRGTVFDFAGAGLRLETASGALPGYWLNIRRPVLDAGLTALPACRLVASKARFEAGDPEGFYVWFAPDFDQGQFGQVVRIWPVIAGTDYPLGAPS